MHRPCLYSSMSIVGLMPVTTTLLLNLANQASFTEGVNTVQWVLSERSELCKLLWACKF